MIQVEYNTEYNKIITLYLRLLAKFDNAKSSLNDNLFSFNIGF